MSRNSATTAVSNNNERPGNGAVHELAHRFWRSAIDYGIKKGYGGKGVLHAWVAGNLAQEGDYSNLNEYANHWDDRAEHSEMGSNLWVCAPSSDLSKDPTISTAINQGRYRDDFGGISAATPQVAGLRRANPNLTWRDNKIILATSARKNDTTEPGWEEGGLKFDSSTERCQFNNSTGSGSSTPRPPWSWQRTGARCPNSVRPSARRDR